MRNEIRLINLIYDEGIYAYQLRLCSGGEEKLVDFRELQARKC